MKLSVSVLFLAMAVASVAWGQTGPADSAPALGKLPYTIALDTTVVVKPLKADGTPDYIAALNEKFGVFSVALKNLRSSRNAALAEP